MSIRAMTNKLFAIVLMQMLVLINSYSILQAKDSAQPSVSTTINFTGRWVDQQNAGIKMSVREDGGIFRITGGDEAYGYQISCLAKDMSAVCTGNGGRLEGENFLYQSSFQFNNDGTLLESWKAFNNLQSVSGKTIWKRP